MDIKRRGANSSMKVRYFQDKRSLWRWSVKARNGKIVCDGSEGYYSRSNAKRAYRHFWFSAPFGGK